MAERRPPPDECANCGASIPRTARACPECGADERTGWRESSLYDGLDLPDAAFADETTAGSGGANRTQTRRINGVAWYWWLAGVLLVLALILAGLGLR